MVVGERGGNDGGGMSLEVSMKHFAKRLQFHPANLSVLSTASVLRGASLTMRLLLCSGSLVTLGAEFKRLMVVGERGGNDGGGMRLEVSTKHFAKCLQFHPAKPDCAFYGVGSQGASLTVVFQFFVPGSRRTDKSISLHCRLAVLDTGSS
ncbi:hypothetical protein Nepgr_020769 [Nepenthes gracilis]|uniref:Uncharacterized protein n=1 Tax=Nepenthes gracilis TaxID=150966 RepID=A0AAD3XVI5_NEPGR|nr:hypothetical protein Nepgr_020769 [Nepenthes gracilis]